MKLDTWSLAGIAVIFLVVLFFRPSHEPAPPVKLPTPQVVALTPEQFDQLVKVMRAMVESLSQIPREALERSAPLKPANPRSEK